MQSIESASALLGLDAAPLVLLDLDSRSWMDAPLCWDMLRGKHRMHI